MGIEESTYTDGHYVFSVGKATTRYLYGIPYINFKENTQYTMTIKGYSVGNNPESNDGKTNFRIVFKYTDGTSSFQTLNSLTETKLTYTSSANKTIEKVYMYYGYSGNAYISYIQLEEGTQSTSYEPYQGSTTRINLTGHDPLMCLGDNCDYIDYENNRIVRNVGKYTVTGNENWTLTKALNSYAEYGEIVDDAAKFYTSSSKFSFYYQQTAPNNKPMYIKSSLATAADFKSNLQSLYSSNPMIIYYELAEPQFESIDLPQVNLRWDSNTFVTDGYITKTYN